MATDQKPVWVVESNAIFRRGIVSCLKAGGILVAGDSALLPRSEDLHRIAVLVTELDGDGLVAGAAARISADRLKLIGIATGDRPEVLEEAVDAGFSGLLMRSELTPDALIAVVQAVLSGAGSLPLSALTRMLADPGRASRPRSARGLLTAREVAVLRLVSQGRSTREIAGELSYSERTVKNVVHDTLTKLNCRTRTQAVAVLTRQGAL